MADILIIDDEEPVRSTIRSMLEFGGHDVREAPGGQDGLDAIKKQRPDLVLCDITMPGMGGFQTLKVLRENNPQYDDLPFVFLSALAGNSDVIAGLDCGADDYLTKPVDHKLLLVKVKAFLRQSARFQEKKKREHVKLYKALSKYGEEMPNDSQPPHETTVRCENENTAETETSNFDEQFQEFIQKGATGSAGKLHFINLSEIKEQFAERWNRISQTAMNIAESVIARHLTKQALFSRSGAEAFFVLFPDLSEKEAEQQVESIANEIAARLLGESESAYRQLSLTATTADVSGLLEQETSPTLASLIAAFEKRTSTLPQQSNAISYNVAERFFNQVTIKFQPVWTTETERIVAYQGRWFLPAHGDGVSAKDTMPENLYNELTVASDLLLAHNVAAYLKKTAYQDNRAFVYLPIHGATLLGETRNKIAEILDDVPRGELRDFLVIEVIISSASSDIPALLEAISFLKPRCRFMAARCRPHHEWLSQFREWGVAVLSMQCASDHNASDPNRAARDLKVFAQRAGALRLEPYVHGVDARGGLKSAIFAGIRMIGGRAIAKEVDVPGEKYRLPKQKLMIG